MRRGQGWAPGGWAPGNGRWRHAGGGGAAALAWRAALPSGPWVRGPAIGRLIGERGSESAGPSGAPARTLLQPRPETHLRLLLVCCLSRGGSGAPGRAIAPGLQGRGADRAALRAAGPQGPLCCQGVRGGRHDRHPEPPKGENRVKGPPCACCSDRWRAWRVIKAGEIAKMGLGRRGAAMCHVRCSASVRLPRSAATAEEGAAFLCTCLPLCCPRHAVHSHHQPNVIQLGRCSTAAMPNDAPAAIPVPCQTIKNYRPSLMPASSLQQQCVT